MRARVIVFPIKGRSWCFSRSIDPSLTSSGHSGSTTTSPSTLSGLWKTLSSNSKPLSANAELVVDFVSNKMNSAWMKLEKAPEGSIKNKVHGVGVWLLTRVQPSEIFLKSIGKDVTGIDITYPASLNPRLVRRRLRHVALSGTNVHKKYMYGSATLLPLTTAFTVLPLPNIPFFWLLFRTYSHWRALQGSEKLLQLVLDSSQLQNDTSNENKTEGDSYGKEMVTKSHWVMQPSKELDDLAGNASEEGLSDSAINHICETFHLNPQEVLKYKK
ncbi:hypothetical protein V2J09_004572 [Rumex salicifolius]